MTVHNQRLLVLPGKRFAKPVRDLRRKLGMRDEHVRRVRRASDLADPSRATASAERIDNVSHETFVLRAEHPPRYAAGVDRVDRFCR